VTYLKNVTLKTTGDNLFLLLDAQCHNNNCDHIFSTNPACINSVQVWNNIWQLR